MGSTGDSYDSALAEALNSLYEAELIDNEARPGYAGPWRDRREVERETAAWVHWYNTRRPHLALGGITPQQAENQHTTTRKEAASTSLHKTQDLTPLCP
ncbi:integrase core domain protein [Actinomyces sp. ICM58]|nr:integrase core domain protein [Actinomyces sp. ICM58]